MQRRETDNGSRRLITQHIVIHGYILYCTYRRKLQALVRWLLSQTVGKTCRPCAFTFGRLA